MAALHTLPLTSIVRKKESFTKTISGGSLVLQPIKHRPMGPHSLGVGSFLAGNNTPLTSVTEN